MTPPPAVTRARRLTVLRPDGRTIRQTMSSHTLDLVHRACRKELYGTFRPKSLTSNDLCFRILRHEAYRRIHSFSDVSERGQRKRTDPVSLDESQRCTAERAPSWHPGSRPARSWTAPATTWLAPIP